MNKITKGTIAGLLLVIAFRKINAGCPENNGPHNERKRNLICYFGANHLIPGLFLGAIEGTKLLDPLPLEKSPNSTFFSDGVFFGLSSLRNVTPVIVTCNEGEDVNIHTTLRLSDVGVRYSWNEDLLLPLQGYGWTKTKAIEVEVSVSLCIGQESGMELEDLKVVKLKKFRCGFSGLGFLGPLLSSAAAFILPSRSEAQMDVEKFLTEQLDNVLGLYKLEF